MKPLPLAEKKDMRPPSSKVRVVGQFQSKDAAADAPVSALSAPLMARVHSRRVCWLCEPANPAFIASFLNVPIIVEGFALG
jgi:hypothetical protein